MNIKKSLLLLLTAILVLSCTQDDLKDQNIDQTANLTTISQYDNSSMGIYKGAFTTLDAAERGIIEIQILNDVPAKGTLTLTSGRTYNLVSDAVYTESQIITNLRLASELTKDVVLNFSVDADGNNPVFSNILLNGSESSILVAKETSRAPVVPITGTYLCLACGTHPTLGTGATQTFNMVYTGDGSGTDTIMTEITLDSTTYTSTIAENSQGACVANGPFMDCPINGTTTVNPTNLINWTGTHTYDTVGDCSQASGTWTYDSPVYGSLSGNFVSDTQCLPPVNDLCGDAIAVVCGSVETATTSAATDTGEPLAWCGSTDPNGPGIWYVYTSTGDADNVTIDTCGSNYDTKLFVYTDGCGTLTCLTGNDDSCGLQSSVTFNEGLTAGVEFLIYAAGFNGATGSFILNVNCTPAAPGDTFELAVPIIPSPEGTGCATDTFTFDVPGDGYTDSGLDGTCATAGPDKFFTWTATSLGLTFDNGAGGPGIVIRTAAGVEIECTGTFGSGTFTGWALNDVLNIQIFDSSGSNVVVGFCLEEFTPPPPPPTCGTTTNTFIGTTGAIADGSCPTTDNFTATSTATGTIGTDADIDNVTINITHTFTADLEIFLTSPNGTQLELSTDNGGSGDNYTGTIFRDGGATPVGASPPFTGIFQAEGGTFAAAFAGEPVNGVWTLNVCDDAGSDAGTVDSWSIGICDSVIPDPLLPTVNYVTRNQIDSNKEKAKAEMEVRPTVKK